MVDAHGRSLFGPNDVPWIALASAGLALCMVITGVFDTIAAGFVAAASFAVRITSDDPLSGGLGIVVACAFLALVPWRRRRAPSLSPVGAAVLGVAQVLSVAVMYLSAAGALAAGPGEAAGIVAGAVSTVLLALYAQVLAARGCGVALVVLALALLLDVLLELLATHVLPVAAKVAFVVAAAVLSPLLLLVLERARVAGAVGACEGKAAPVPAPRIAAARAVSSYDIPFYLAIVRVFVLAVLICASYFTGVFGSDSIGVGMLVMTVARPAIVIYIWLLACDVPWGRGWPAFAFAVGWGAFTVANTLSTKLGIYVLADQSAWYLAYNVLVMLCLVSLVLVEVLPQRLGVSLVSGAVAFAGMRTGCRTCVRFDPGDGEGVCGADKDGPQRAAGADAQGVPDAAPCGADLLVLRCEALARARGLTARELEVLVPLMRGRSAATIAGTLCMSVETARTHIRHIYQKVDVHAREDLMDLVDAVEVPGC